MTSMRIRRPTLLYHLVLLPFSPLRCRSCRAMSSSTSHRHPPFQLPDSMKTIVYAGDDSSHKRAQLREQTRPVPSCPKATGQPHVLIRVHAAGLNPVDAKDVIGDKLPHSWTTLRSMTRSHLLHDKIPGFDFAGVVVDCSSSSGSSALDSFQPGDRVFGTMPPFGGTLAEYICAPVDQVCYMPSTLTMVQAAALPLVGLTAVQCLSPYVHSGKSVLVLGASGGTGHVALQVARRLGAEHVTAVCSKRNANFCRENGATTVVSYDENHDDSEPKNDEATRTRALLKRLIETPGCPYAVVMDCVTSADPADQRMQYPRLIQETGNQNPSEPLLTRDYIYRRLGGASIDWVRAGLERVTGIQCWSNRHEKLFWIRFPKSAPELRQLQEWANENGKDKTIPPICPQVSKVYPFTASGVQEAFDAILERRVKGKVVVQVYDENSNKSTHSK